MGRNLICLEVGAVHSCLLIAGRRGIMASPRSWALPGTILSGIGETRSSGLLQSIRIAGRRPVERKKPCAQVVVARHDGAVDCPVLLGMLRLTHKLKADADGVGMASANVGCVMSLAYRES